MNNEQKTVKGKIMEYVERNDIKGLASFACAMVEDEIMESHKGENWRKGYQTGVAEIEKAYGGCKKCYGKGYSTVLEHISGGHGRSTVFEQLPRMHFCSCERGKGLQKEMELRNAELVKRVEGLKFRQTAHPNEQVKRELANQALDDALAIIREEI